VATLEQVAADESLLRRLDLSESQPYPVRGEDLRRVVAYIEASPVDLSKRMALVESKLSGKHRLVLTTPGEKLAEKLRGITQLTSVALWPVPFEVWQKQLKVGDAGLESAMREMYMFESLPSLLTGRALHFKGLYEGEDGAKKKYLDARLPDSYIENYRLPEKVAKKFSRTEDISRVEAAQEVVLRHAKQSASMWIGLIFFEQKDYPDAIEYFANRLLQANPSGIFTTSARYNLARTYEANGETAKAVALYQADKTSPQSHGNQLRARWLSDKQATAEAR
jgi:hypothetical protein